MLRLSLAPAAAPHLRLEGGLQARHVEGHILARVIAEGIYQLQSGVVVVVVVVGG